VRNVISLPPLHKLLTLCLSFIVIQNQVQRKKNKPINQQNYRTFLKISSSITLNFFNHSIYHFSRLAKIIFFNNNFIYVAKDKTVPFRRFHPFVGPVSSCRNRIIIISLPVKPSPKQLLCLLQKKLLSSSGSLAPV
jgi:hypothetical protein